MLNNIDDRKVLILSITASLLSLFGGVTHMLSQWQYYEPGQGILLSIYVLGCLVLFFALRFIKVTQILAAFLLLGLIIFYSNQKFEWRKSYIQNAFKGQPFLLEEYITQYPTMEEHSFGWLWGAQSWIQFAEDCVRPALTRANPANPACRSEAGILDEYKIDVKEAINAHFRKMQSTARRIEEGQLSDKNQYQNCLRQKQCAMIPLLPANVDAEALSRDSQDYIDIRQAFWSLINDTTLSPAVCEYMLLCRAMRNSSIVPIPLPTYGE